MGRINLSFIKLDINIMNDSKIKVLCKMPGGSDLFKLWIGVLCLAMKSGRPGFLEIGDGIPFSPLLLSGELDISPATVELGLRTFQELKMIEIYENQDIYITNFETHQSLDKIRNSREKTRKRVQKYREKNCIEKNNGNPLQNQCNQLQVNSNPLQPISNPLQPQCNANVTPLEEEIDKDKDKESISSDSPKNSDAPKKIKKTNYSEEFNQFWDCYPKNRRVGKQKAFSSWKRLKPPIGKCLETLEAFKSSQQWRESGGQYIPHPTTWLNRGGWEDETEGLNDMSNPWNQEANFEL